MAEELTVEQLSIRIEHQAEGAASLDLRPLLLQIRQWLYTDTAENFAQSRTPSGGQMAPLKYRIGQPLIKSGQMMEEVLASVATGQIDDDSLTVTARDPMVDGWSLPAIHQHGTRTIPARPFIGWSQETIDRIVSATADLYAQSVVGSPGAEVQPWH